MCVAFVLLVAPRGWACQSVDAVPMSTASVGTEHSALHFGVINRIVLLTERDAERCDLVRFDKSKRATRRFQNRLWWQKFCLCGFIAQYPRCQTLLYSLVCCVAFYVVHLVCYWHFSVVLMLYMCEVLMSVRLLLVLFLSSRGLHSCRYSTKPERVCS